MRAVPRDPAVGLAPGAAVPVPSAGPLRARLPRRLLLALVALAATAGVAAGIYALTDTGAVERSAPAAGPVLLAGKPLQSANCTAWWTAGAAEQGAAVAALTRSIGGPTPYGPGTTLPAARVHRLFDRVCTPTFASHFLLYEIYIRAAGMKSLGD
ncbi:MAG: hypothetical protein QOJ14_467 [Thermoleophilaceae bacterium]|nr:hypothetical protein [Thermoleophilaceae bacterium]